MIVDPDRYVADFRKAGADLITVPLWPAFTSIGPFKP